MAGSDNYAVIEISKIEGKKIANAPTNIPRVGVSGTGIYGLDNGKYCHQCRQKKKDITSSCKSFKKGKLCTILFCPKCLLNRYGENLEEVGKLEDWICPKCRGVCNCSCCMRRKGFQPTGILTPTAKATGFNSVLALLHGRDGEVLEPQNALKESTASPKKSSLSYKDSTTSKRTRDQENQNVEQKHVKPSEEGLQNKEKRLKMKDDTASKEDIVLPLGMPLTDVAGISMPVQDVGATLQFLEFCCAFSEVLDIKKGQPECILQDLFRGWAVCHGARSTLVDFHINLLSLIEEDMEKDGDAWLKILKRCLEESQCFLDELPMDFLDWGLSWYDNLGPSRKLNILNFLCDEALGTKKLRNWIDGLAVKFDKERKNNKEKVLAAKRKEKFLKQKLKDEKAKAMVSAPGKASLAEFDDLISQLKTEAGMVHSEVLASLELVHKMENQRSDAVRTEHVMLGSGGQRFWKLSGYNSCSSIILQDIGSWDSGTLQDEWSFYSQEEEVAVEKYISSIWNSKRVIHPSDDVEDGTKSDSSDSPESEHDLPQGMV